MEFVAILILSVVVSLSGVDAVEQRQVPLPPFCGDLAEADCQLLADAQELMADVGSMAIAWQVEAAMSGIPEMADEDLVFRMMMDMNFHLDPMLNEQLRALAADSSQEPLAAQDELVQKIVDFYSSMAMELDTQLALPGVLLRALEADEGVVLPDTITMQMRMLDGYTYVNMDALAESMPELAAEMASTGIEGWIGFDFAGQLEQQMSRVVPAPDTSMLESMQMGMAFEQMMADETVRTLLEPYISIERLEDEDRDGVPVAVFHTSFDLARWVSHPNFTRILREAADSLLAVSGETVDPQELGTTLLGVQLIANILARSFEFQQVQAIGIEEPYLYDFSTSLKMDLSGILTLLSMSGEELPPELLGATPRFSFTLDASYAHFDNAPAVDVPEGAQIIPLDSLDQDSMDIIS